MRGQTADASSKTRRNQLRERRAWRLNPLPSVMFLVPETLVRLSIQVLLICRGNMPSLSSNGKVLGTTNGGAALPRAAPDPDCMVPTGFINATRPGYSPRLARTETGSYLLVQAGYDTAFSFRRYPRQTPVSCNRSHAISMPATSKTIQSDARGYAGRMASSHAKKLLGVPQARHHPRLSARL